MLAYCCSVFFKLLDANAITLSSCVQWCKGCPYSFLTSINLDDDGSVWVEIPQCGCLTDDILEFLKRSLLLVIPLEITVCSEAAPREWNALSKNLRTIKDFGVFKRQLKTSTFQSMHACMTHMHAPTHPPTHTHTYLASGCMIQNMLS